MFRACHTTYIKYLKSYVCLEVTASIPSLSMSPYEGFYKRSAHWNVGHQLTVPRQANKPIKWQFIFCGNRAILIDAAYLVHRETIKINQPIHGSLCVGIFCMVTTLVMRNSNGYTPLPLCHGTCVAIQHTLCDRYRVPTHMSISHSHVKVFLKVCRVVTNNELIVTLHNSLKLPN